MSYGDRNNSYRGGGGRRRYNREDRDYEDRNRREIVESPQERLKNAILKLGEVDPVEEIPQLERNIRQVTPAAPSQYILANLSEAFRIGVTEQPFKIPYYTTVLRRLHGKGEEDIAEPEGPSLGRLILEDFWKGFQGYMDKLAWRETRSCIHFFAHLTVAKLISPDSLATLLQSFTTVLDEFGVSHGRAKQAAMCAAEGLMIAGVALKPAFKARVSEIITAIETYSESFANSKWIVHPAVPLHSTPTPAPESSDTKWLSSTIKPVQGTLGENVEELFDLIISTLKTLDAADFVEQTDSYPRPYLVYPDLDSATFTPFDIPSVLVPPEVIEMEGSSESTESVPLKKDDWPVYFIQLFDNDVTPDPKTPTGYAIRSAIFSIVEIFDVNRKECARILLEYPRWIQAGSFRPKPGVPAATEVEPIEGRNWQLESTVIESILGMFLLLPEAPLRSIYYMSLITELCKLSPSTVGPAVGKSLRKLYGGLSDGLDVEISRRFAEWFATHMSNFGFAWVWKEWLPDLSLNIAHPKRRFMSRAVEFEMRLSYYDRIVKTLPEPMQTAEAQVLPAQAPTPNFEYEDASNPHHDAAQAVLNLLRGRTKAEDVISHIDTLKSQLVDTYDDGSINVDKIVRSIAIQSLLNIGSRSFSHLLNAIERYLPLLRYLATGGTSSAATGTGNVEAKNDILTAAASFWKYNPQLVGIVFDKLMQYQIVDPTDVVDWTFVSGSLSPEISNFGAFQWDLLKAALDKANGRVLVARKKVTAMRKEDDEKRAREKADMDVDGDGTKPETEESDSPALTTALKAFVSLTKEQKTALSRALEGFTACLAPSPVTRNQNPEVRTVVLEAAWNDRSNWGEDAWTAYETWCWYRHFCRTFSTYLRTYSNTLSAISFAKFEGVTDDPAVNLLTKTFNIATGEYS